MRTAAAALLLALARTAFAAGPIPPVGCPSCILNTAAPQNAQINIGTATIRGTLDVSTLSVVNFAISNLTATTIVGSGAGLTNLNASQLASGTVPVARLAGSYTGITGVGTISAGTWNGSLIGTQYGGTGKNWAAVGRGALPFFDATGSMGTLAPDTTNKLLQTNGAGADPSWTAAPTILGTNITAIPLANLQTGNLPAAIKATDASLVTVSGTKVTGDISGNAESINGTLPLAQLEPGTLAADIIAQTLDNIGTPVGTFGGPTLAAQVTVNNQGRVTNIAQFAIPGVSTRTAFIDVDNNWHGSQQTSLSTWTFVNAVNVQGTLSLSNPLGVASGGTGRATLTANAIPYGLGTSAIGLLPVLGNGGLVIGTSGVPSTGTLTGTANQVVVTNGAGSITLSLPQSIGTGSSPTFAGLTLSSPLTVPNGGSGATTLTNHGVLLGHGTNAVSATAALGPAGIIVGTDTSVDPSTATLTGTANQITVTQSATEVNLSLPQNINIGAAPTFTGTNFTGIPQSGVTNLVSDLASIASSTASLEASKVNRAGDTMTGQLTISGSSLTVTGDTLLQATTVAATLYAAGDISIRNIHKLSTATLTGATQISYFGRIAGSTTGIVTNLVGITDQRLSTNSVNNTIGLILLPGGASAASFTDQRAIFQTTKLASGNQDVRITATSSSTFPSTMLFSILNPAAGPENQTVNLLLSTRTLSLSGTQRMHMGINTNSNQRLNFTSAPDLVVDGNVVFDRGLTVSTITAGGNVFLSTASGSVGIGTTSPGEILQLGDGVTAGDRKIRMNSAAANEVGVKLSKAGTDKWQAYVPASSDDLRFYDSTAGLDRVTLQQGGNVGISTTNPSATLDVVGTGKFGTDGTRITLTATGEITSPSSVTASAFFGNGANLTELTAANISAGTLGPAVIASSVAASGVTPGSYGSASSVPTFTVGVDGRLTAAADASIQIAESQVTNLVSDLTAIGASTASLDTSKVNRSGDTMTGQLTNTSSITVTGANGFRAVFTNGESGTLLPGTITLQNFGANPTVSFSRVNGTSISSTVVLAASTIGILNFRGYDGLSAASNRGSISMQAEDTFSVGNTPTNILFVNQAPNTASNVTRLRMVITSTGPVVMGDFASNVTGLADSVTAQLTIIPNTGLAAIYSSSGSLISGSSVIASGFFGNGSNITAITAANISAGTLGPAVIASSVAAITTAATCGNSTTSCGITFGADGRITNVSSNTITSSGVTAVDTTTWSGTNTFVGLTKISAGASVFFPSTLGFTSAQTSFTPSATVTGSTITFTVVGTTVTCWTSGRVNMSAGDQVNVGIGVDGSVTAIPGTTTTIGFGTGYSAGSNIRTGIQTHFEFQVSANTQHSFFLGIWSGGATMTFPDNQSIAQFGCREVPSR